MNNELIVGINENSAGMLAHVPPNVLRNFRGWQNFFTGRAAKIVPKHKPTFMDGEMLQEGATFFDNFTVNFEVSSRTPAGASERIAEDLKALIQYTDLADKVIVGSGSWKYPVDYQGPEVIYPESPFSRYVSVISTRKLTPEERENLQQLMTPAAIEHTPATKKLGMIR